MKRLRPFLLFFALGCGTPGQFRADGEPGQAASIPGESDLQRNLRAGRNWEEQERMMSDVKNAFGVQPNADASGPGK